jgi:perosamine synthetase
MSDNFIPISKPNIEPRERQLVLDALDSGGVSSIGKYIDEFEEKLHPIAGLNVHSPSATAVPVHLGLATLGIKARTDAGDRAVWRRAGGHLGRA